MDAGGRFQLIDLEVDLEKQTVQRNGQAILLPDLSFRLLKAMLRHALQVRILKELMHQIDEQRNVDAAVNDSEAILVTAGAVIG